MGGIERGERNPALINIGRTANALGVPPAALFEFAERKPKKKG
jgi:transcriptional regulator with XRE-family HTH domain